MERVEGIRPTLDPRTKLAVLLLVNVIVIASPDLHTEWVCVGVIVLSLLLMSAFRRAVRSVLTYAAMLGLMYICGLFPDSVVSAFVLMLIVCFRKIAPSLFIAGGMIATTKVGELVSAMQRIRIPKPIVITFAVTLRFFPAVREEYAGIKDAMRLRGIGVSFVNVLTRPLTVLESVMIPMLMRCATIAEELSAASVTRGIESAGRRTSYTELKMRAPDWAVITVFIALVAFTLMGGVSVLSR